LVRVDFGWLSKKSVVLAVRSAIVPDEELVKQSAVAFGELFNSKEHLDICFLTEEQEQSCAQVAKPFFEKE
jgi:hypothetical protein